jgi:DNA helicase HerA-like ATPase
MALVLIFDPHGEYAPLAEISNTAETVIASYRPFVTLFRSAYHNLKNDKKKQFTRNELRQQIESLRDSGNDSCRLLQSRAAYDNGCNSSPILFLWS